uniref:hypothetical protein n=1 Tax=Porogramme epimiltina TaxID=81058 RepID=UPI0030FDFCC7
MKYILFFKQNNFASHLARILVCAKYTCHGIAGGTGVLAGAVTFDQVLESSGREKIFLPFIGRLFNDIFGEPMGDQHISNLKTSANPVAPDGQYVQLLNNIVV